MANIEKCLVHYCNENNLVFKHKLYLVRDYPFCQDHLAKKSMDDVIKCDKCRAWFERGYDCLCDKTITE